MFSTSFKFAAAVVALSLVDQAMAQSPAPQAHGGYMQYPQLQAPLYPAPVQHTPAWQGGTLVTNQAFAPHEMLYPHSYHAMYGPFYYRVKGGWAWTPFGVRQHEQVKLEGTEVMVKYKSHYPLLSGFRPPRTDKSLVNLFSFR